MTSEVPPPGVDVAQIMRDIRRRIAEKKGVLYTDEELREIAGHRLEPVLDARDLESGLLAELIGGRDRWSYAFGAETVYRSSRGALGRALEGVRRILRPVQKLFWNPNPMIAALSRQSDLNSTFVHLLHNLALEVTRLNLEAQDLRNRILQLQGRLELSARRQKTLEELLAPPAGEGPPSRGGGGA